MQVEITKAILERLKSVLCADPFDMEEKKVEWRDTVPLSLHKHKRDDLERLATALDGATDLKGTKTLARDIRTWIKASCLDGAKMAKARKVTHACSLLIEYIRTFPHHQVYQRDQDDAEGVVLCYYVENLEYHPSTRDSPEYIKIELGYHDLGVSCSMVVMLRAGDVLAKTPHEILILAGLLPETEELRMDYDDFMQKFGQINGKIGKQYIAVGCGILDKIDGNSKNDDSYRWSSSSSGTILLGRDGGSSRVVIDVNRESDKERGDRDEYISTTFWRSKFNLTKEKELVWDGDEDSDVPTADDEVEIPYHPHVVCFDLKRHKRMKVHVGNLREYVYDKTNKDKLIMPKKNQRLVDTLLADSVCKFKDIIKGKSGGVIVICQGPPGTGKTLTAEVYAEDLGRPLYSIQCAQLGTSADELETTLMKCLSRGQRWGAVVLLDEADVYLQERGRDIEQNAIVGVFLRVLEYYGGVLFMTTNRLDSIDDAILSRCTARVVFQNPDIADQRKIWEVISQANEINIPTNQLDEIIEHHNNMSGRDIKNVVKLCGMITQGNGSNFTKELVDEIKEFKPTTGD